MARAAYTPHLDTMLIHLLITRGDACILHALAGATFTHYEVMIAERNYLEDGILPLGL